MNYKRIYDNLMESRLLLKEERIKLRKQGEYFEAHHIVPKSMGGEGKKGEYRHNNIVLLTGREHYISHAILWLVYKNREMAAAFNSMCIIKKSNNNTVRRNYVVSSRMYEAVRKHISELGHSEETRKKIGSYSKGRTFSEEAKQKLRETRRLHPRIVSEETKLKISKAQKGKIITEETRLKIKLANERYRQTPEYQNSIERARMKMKGRKLTKEHRLKISQGGMGRTMSPESIRKRTETRKKNLKLGITKQYKPSEETRKKISITLKQRKLSSEHRMKIGLAHKGKKILQESVIRAKETKIKNGTLCKSLDGKLHLKPEIKQKISKANSGKKMSIETKEKLRKANLGKKMSPEAIKKSVETRKMNTLLGFTKKRVLSSDTKEKIRQGNLGKKHSSERIAKRIETRKRNKLLKLAQMEGSGGQGE